MSTAITVQSPPTLTHYKTSQRFICRQKTCNSLKVEVDESRGPQVDLAERVRRN